MSLKATGYAMAGIAGIVFVYVVLKLVLLLRSYPSVGFDLSGIWRMWGVWIILWCIALVAGLWMIISSRPAN
jgi:hypothetical protein